MSDSHADRLRLSDSVEALTRPRTHREPYTVRTDTGWLTQRHVTEVRSLIDQLQDALEPGGSADSGHAVPGSRPPARLEAIDVLLLIDTEASQWIGFLGLHERPSLAGNLHALVGVSGEIEDTDLRKLAKNAGRWVVMANVLTGWEVPAWRPNSTCPLCAVRGGLRVRAGDGISETGVSAVCVECSETWDASNIRLLGAHIRNENLDEPMGETA